MDAPQNGATRSQRVACFIDLADAQASVADYVDYYTHKHCHSSIGYLKPYLFHQQQLSNITQFSPAQLDHPRCTVLTFA